MQTFVRFFDFFIAGLLSLAVLDTYTQLSVVKCLIIAAIIASLFVALQGTPRFGFYMIYVTSAIICPFAGFTGYLLYVDYTDEFSKLTATIICILCIVIAYRISYKLHKATFQNSIFTKRTSYDLMRARDNLEKNRNYAVELHTSIKSILEANPTLKCTAYLDSYDIVENDYLKTIVLGIDKSHRLRSDSGYCYYSYTRLSQQFYENITIGEEFLNSINAAVQDDIKIPNQQKEAPMSFFAGCNDAESIKKRYRDLSKIYHPDAASGDSSSFVNIQNEYEELLAKFQN